LHDINLCVLEFQDAVFVVDLVLPSKYPSPDMIEESLRWAVDKVGMPRVIGLLYVHYN